MVDTADMVDTAALLEEVDISTPRPKDLVDTEADTEVDTVDMAVDTVDTAVDIPMDIALMLDMADTVDMAMALDMVTNFRCSSFLPTVC